MEQPGLEMDTATVTDQVLSRLPIHGVFSVQCFPKLCRDLRYLYQCSDVEQLCSKEVKGGSQVRCAKSISRFYGSLQTCHSHTGCTRVEEQICYNPTPRHCSQWTCTCITTLSCSNCSGCMRRGRKEGSLGCSLFWRPNQVQRKGSTQQRRRAAGLILKAYVCVSFVLVASRHR